MTNTVSPTVGNSPGAPGLVERLKAQRRLPDAQQRRAIREAARASLRDVASEVEVSPTAVWRWERGANPGRRTAAYADLLDELRRLAG